LSTALQFECLKNPNNESKDVVIVTVPYTDTSFPLMAPACLKPVVERAGFSCLATDLNAEIYNYIKKHKDSMDFMPFFFDETLYNENIKQELFDIFESSARQILSWKPKFVGLSLISYVNQSSAKWLCWFLKRLDPSITILIGGPGCLPRFTGPSEWAEHIISLGLVDYHIRGDGEHSLYEFLKGKKDYIGINSLEWREFTLEEMRKLPTPDYTQYKFDKYSYPALGLTGSRGCVRKCKFCDYIANWPTFTWRTADDIFAEMVTQYEKHGVRVFKFQDSLTNGNQREFRHLTKLLTDWNTANPEKSFKWSGFYIFREHGSDIDELWRLVAGSGADALAVGIENLNERIRYDMGKKFSNEAIDAHLHYAKKYGVTIQMLNIVGWIDETEEEIDFIKDWLRTHTEYKDIMYLVWGGTLGIFPNTWLSRNWENLGLTKIGDQPPDWVNEKVGSTPDRRARWVLEIEELSEELGYNVIKNLDNHFILESLMKGDDIPVTSKISGAAQLIRKDLVKKDEIQVNAI